MNDRPEASEFGQPHAGAADVPRPQGSAGPGDRGIGHLLRAIEERTAIVGIIGMGYIGLPLMLAACRAGFRVLGFDIDAAKVSQLNEGRSPLAHIGHANVARVLDGERFTATADFSRLRDAAAILICVPTPLGPHREPNLRYVADTAQTIAANLGCEQLISLESTTYPQTTSRVVRPILESSGARSGRDFYLAYSPEREDPGNPDFATSQVPKIVSGDGADALALASALYGSIFAKIIPVSSLETGEAVKLTENIFRAVNIALVNELKMVYARMGIDIFEVIDAAKTKPFGYMPFYPGPGLGGHCIPIDPFYLTWKAREFGVSTKFIELAGEINTGMPHYVIERLREELDRRFGRGLSRAHLLIVGVAYKKNIDDMRESPALAIFRQLEQAGAKVDYCDPHVPALPLTRAYAELAGRRSISFDETRLADYDAAIIVTDHDDCDYAMLVRCSKLVIDTRNACARVPAGRERVVKA